MRAICHHGRGPGARAPRRLHAVPGRGARRIVVAGCGRADDEGGVPSPKGDTAFRGVYCEIVPPERLVYTFEWEGLPGHISTETVTFVERDGKTTLINRVEFASVEDRDGMLRSGMEKGATETMDRLAELLGSDHEV